MEMAVIDCIDVDGDGAAFGGHIHCRHQFLFLIGIHGAGTGEENHESQSDDGSLRPAFLMHIVCNDLAILGRIEICRFRWTFLGEQRNRHREDHEEYHENEPILMVDDRRHDFDQSASRENAAGHQNLDEVNHLLDQECCDLDEIHHVKTGVIQRFRRVIDEPSRQRRCKYTAEETHHADEHIHRHHAAHVQEGLHRDEPQLKAVVHGDRQDIDDHGLLEKACSLFEFLLRPQKNGGKNDFTEYSEKCHEPFEAFAADRISSPLLHRDDKDRAPKRPIQRFAEGLSESPALVAVQNRKEHSKGRHHSSPKFHGRNELLQKHL